MAPKLYTGINIQFPISRLILEGKKTVETRTYPIPPNYIGKEMFIVETPGKSGKFKSRIVGVVVFGQSFKYKSAKDFYRDEVRHCVDPDSPWAWDIKKGKWGWPIEKIQALKVAVTMKQRLGIVYTKNIRL